MPEKKPSTRSSKPTSKPAARSAAKPRTGATSRSTGASKPTADELENEEQQPAARPVAVSGAARRAPLPDAPADLDDAVEPSGSEPPAAAEPFDAAEPSGLADDPGSFDEPSVVERPRIELLTGLSALLMSLGTLLGSWYDRGAFLGKVKGISSGNFGPVVFFLGLAVVAIVAVRAMRRPIAFPLETPWILEGIGWLCILLLFLKRTVLQLDGSRMLTMGWLLAFIPAIGVATLGGYTSSHAPFVVKPGWQRSRAGRLGVGIVAGALVAGVVVGFVVKPAVPARAQPAKTEKGTPSCGKSFPKPAGMTPVQGQSATIPGQGSVCSMSLTSALTPAQVVSRYKTALTDAGIRFKAATQAGRFMELQLTGPVCGALFAQDATSTKKGSVVQISTLPCALTQKK